MQKVHAVLLGSYRLCTQHLCINDLHFTNSMSWSRWKQNQYIYSDSCKFNCCSQLLSTHILLLSSFIASFVYMFYVFGFGCSACSCPSSVQHINTIQQHSPLLFSHRSWPGDSWCCEFSFSVGVDRLCFRISMQFFLKAVRIKDFGPTQDDFSSLLTHGLHLQHSHLRNSCLCTLLTWTWPYSLPLPLALPSTNRVATSQPFTPSLQNTQEKLAFYNCFIFIRNDCDSCGLKDECCKQSYESICLFLNLFMEFF